MNNGILKLVLQGITTTFNEIRDMDREGEITLGKFPIQSYERALKAFATRFFLETIRDDHDL